MLCTCGMTLLFTALWMPPQGIIDSSVLVAYGEVMTFVGGLVGIDYGLIRILMCWDGRGERLPLLRRR